MSIHIWEYTVSWEPEGRYHYSKISRWEAEGHYRHKLLQRYSALLVLNGTSLNSDNALTTWMCVYDTLIMIIILES